jgi:antitoxin component YwqK of YwqJK toxin-antitoxin module
MKTLIIYFSLLAFSFSLAAQDSLGFTNKAEAKNQVVNGLKEGKWVEYVDREGYLTTDSNTGPYYLNVYKAGKHYGISRYYSMDRKTVIETPYNEYGEINGTEKVYDQNGLIWQETPWINNKKNGVEKAYSDNGTPIHETPFTNDRISGVERLYYGSGKLFRETPYKDGAKSGMVKWYYEDGALECQATYHNDSVQNGVVRSIYDNEDFPYIVKSPFKDGKEDGMEKSFYTDGALAGEIFYKKGKKEGMEKWYFPDGKLNWELNYTKGKENGTLKQYDDTGKLLNITEWKDGKEGKTINYKENGKEIKP